MPTHTLVLLSTIFDETHNVTPENTLLLSVDTMYEFYEDKPELRFYEAVSRVSFKGDGSLYLTATEWMYGRPLIEVLDLVKGRIKNSKMETPNNFPYMLSWWLGDSDLSIHSGYHAPTHIDYYIRQNLSKFLKRE